MSETPDLTYPGLLDECRAHTAEGRAESRAFLAWFLEHYFRLEELAAQDCVCDGPDDKGVDGIYVDDNLERIDVLQARIIQNPARTIGDSPLRELAGTLAQFDTSAAIEHLVATTGNVELKNRLESEGVTGKVQDGYEVRGVFVTNAPADDNARSFAAGNDRVVVFDADYLSEGYVSVGPSQPVASEARFDVSGFDVIDYRTSAARVLVAPLLASELVSLNGIRSGDLFDWNVRQSLGRTKVNKAIAQSVKDQAEHKNFLLYHNGLTILTTQLEHESDRITLSGYSIVNGCQSITSLFENRDTISSDLRLLGRLIQLAPDSELAARITRHSNNQNSISARDLQSNNLIQRRLQNEMREKYPDIFYEIKRGERQTGSDVLTNEDAARILLAFDVKQPWSCHQSYKLFDELYGDIFARPEVTADRLVSLQQAHRAVLDVLPNITLEVMAKYRLLQFILLYLLRIALETDETGRAFCQRPSEFISEPNGASKLRRSFGRVLDDLVIDFNAEMEERERSDHPFDYKRELKSPQSVRSLQRGILTSYQKAVARGRATGFGEEWLAEEN
ncbi:AIPR family protein [Candidatus Palauibacter sp.]|uniref:AIPR family protein n=1 Tax=Candidatus Palauibacter sp. TaxID=3101350 RepID=UPI003AF23CCF